MKRLSLVLTVAALLLAGCGGDGDGRPPTAKTTDTSSETGSPKPTSTPTSSNPTSSPTPDAAARQALRRAQRALVSTISGSARSVVVLGPGNTISTDMDYDLSARSLSSRATIAGGDDGPLITEAIAIDEEAWTRITRSGGDDPKQTCWISASSQAIEDTTGVEVPADASRGVPPAVLVAVNARAVAMPDPSRVLARIDLYTAAGAFSGRLQILLGIDYDSTATAPVTIRLEDGQITGWRISLFDLLQSAEEAGLELPSQFAGYESQDLSDANVQVDLSEPGKSVDINPPPPDQVVELTQDEDQFEQDMKACTAKLG